jgi:hypothetical protein
MWGDEYALEHTYGLEQMYETVCSKVSKWTPKIDPKPYESSAHIEGKATYEQNTGQNDHDLLKRQPWLQSGEFDNMLYMECMVTVVLDQLELDDEGRLVWDATQRTWVGATHLGYAAWFRDEMIYHRSAWGDLYSHVPIEPPESLIW